MDEVGDVGDVGEVDDVGEVGLVGLVVSDGLVVVDPSWGNWTVTNPGPYAGWDVLRPRDNGGKGSKVSVRNMNRTIVAKAAHGPTEPVDLLAGGWRR